MNTEIISLDDAALDEVCGGTGGLLGLDLSGSAQVSACANVSLGECSALQVNLGVNLGLNLGLAL